jgi:hypothetical protein
MPIETPNPPDDVLEAVRQSMERRTPRRGRLRRALGHAAPAASLSAPQRIFTVDLDALAQGDGIEDTARATGWRFLVEEATEPVAAAEVQDKTGAALPAELTEGQFVRSTAEGLRAAETLAPVEEAAFELRLLRVPALYLVALWLHATEREDLFLPLEPAPAPFEPGHAYPGPRFAELAADLARQALEAQRAAERPGELGA